MKSTSLIILVSLTLIFITCENEDDHETHDYTINYPDTGYYGENILRMDSIDIRGIRHGTYSAYHYSMCVQVPNNSSVDIWMDNTSTDVDAFWSYELGSKAGWIIIDYEYHKQRFVAIGPIFCDLELTFYERGSAEIDIYENESKEPTRTKTISWQY